jgi:hypothetical protein
MIDGLSLQHLRLSFSFLGGTAGRSLLHYVPYGAYRMVWIVRFQPRWNVPRGDDAKAVHVLMDDLWRLHSPERCTVGLTCVTTSVVLSWIILSNAVLIKINRIRRTKEGMRTIWPPRRRSRAEGYVRVRRGKQINPRRHFSSPFLPVVVVVIGVVIVAAAAASGRVFPRGL